MTTDTQTPSAEWPEGFSMLEALVKHMGTDWVREACDEIDEAGDEPMDDATRYAQGAM
jgi:hypothetical protein